MTDCSSSPEQRSFVSPVEGVVSTETHTAALVPLQSPDMTVCHLVCCRCFWVFGLHEALVGTIVRKILGTRRTKKKAGSEAW